MTPTTEPLTEGFRLLFFCSARGPQRTYGVRGTSVTNLALIIVTICVGDLVSGVGEEDALHL